MLDNLQSGVYCSSCNNLIKNSLLFRVVETQRVCEATATPNFLGRCQPEREIEQ